MAPFDPIDIIGIASRLDLPLDYYYHARRRPSPGSAANALTNAAPVLELGNER